MKEIERGFLEGNGWDQREEKEREKGLGVRKKAGMRKIEGGEKTAACKIIWTKRRGTVNETETEEG